MKMFYNKRKPKSKNYFTFMKYFVCKILVSRNISVLSGRYLLDFNWQKAKNFIPTRIYINITIFDYALTIDNFYINK